MTILPENLKPNHCPICGEVLPASPYFVNIYLNNNSMMPQPVCDKDRETLETKEAQRILLGRIKEKWIHEIVTSDQRTEEEAADEIENIQNLEVVWRE